jgi:hypothetical protein
MGESPQFLTLGKKLQKGLKGIVQRILRGANTKLK